MKFLVPSLAFSSSVFDNKKTVKEHDFGSVQETEL